MKSLVTCLILTAVLVTSAVEAKADFQSGNKLFEKCGSPNNFETGVCYGYVEAIVDVLGYATYVGWRACMSEDVTVKQAIDVAMNWLRAHPEQRHFAGSGVVAKAMAEAFPCKP